MAKVRQHVRIETTVRTHKKWLRAGPAACWLWTCGLMYCQDALTDGFIASESLHYLGVPAAEPLADVLVSVGLWETAEGGYQIHDYLEHNNSRAEVQALSKKRKRSGKKGGDAKANVYQVARTDPKQSSSTVLKPPVSDVDTDVVVAADVAVVPKGSPRGVEPPYDVWLRQLLEDYPEQRVTSGHLTEHAFFETLSRDERGPFVAWGVMQANLENQKRGYDWRVKRLIPKLENWLRSGLWKQRHEEHAPDALMSDATSATLGAAAAILKGHA